MREDLGQLTTTKRINQNYFKKYECVTHHVLSHERRFNLQRCSILSNNWFQHHTTLYAWSLSSATIERLSVNVLCKLYAPNFKPCRPGIFTLFNLNCSTVRNVCKKLKLNHNAESDVACYIPRAIKSQEWVESESRLSQNMQWRLPTTSLSFLKYLKT